MGISVKAWKPKERSILQKIKNEQIKEMKANKKLTKKEKKENSET